MPDLAAVQTAIDTAARYGVVQTGVAVDSSYHDTVDYSDPMTLADVAAEGGKITRLRMLTERGYPFMDISYCHATLPDGRTVPVQVTCERPSRYATKRDLIAWAKAEGVYAKGLGLLDESNWSVLYG